MRLYLFSEEKCLQGRSPTSCWRARFLSWVNSELLGRRVVIVDLEKKKLEVAARWDTLFLLTWKSSTRWKAIIDVSLNDGIESWWPTSLLKGKVGKTELGKALQKVFATEELRTLLELLTELGEKELSEILFREVL